MKNGFNEQAKRAVVELLGDVVLDLLADGQPVTNEAIAERIVSGKGLTPDLAVEFALGLLRR